MRKQGVALEDRADVALVRFECVDDGAIQQHLARGGCFEAADEPEGGGLAAAGRTEQ